MPIFVTFIAALALFCLKSVTVLAVLAADAARLTVEEAMETDVVATDVAVVTVFVATEIAAPAT